MAKKRTTTKRTTQPSRRKTAAKKQGIPKEVFAVASPRSIGGLSIFDASDQINSQNAISFFSDDVMMQRSVSLLKEAGFKILQVTDSVINFSGTEKQFSTAFNTKLVQEDRAVIKEFAQETVAQFIDCPDTEMPGLISTQGTAFNEVLEGVALEEPRYFMAASALPPSKEYWHLRVPGDVSLGCNADRVHRTGVSGKGVKVAMVDSGWFKHPYFTSRGYRAASVALGPGAANPLKDESGHGTGESANVFANAPDVELLPVKVNFVNSNGAFNTAVGLQPDIITCSWGSSKRFALSAADQVLATSIATAVASGITVIFSAGNGHFGFPGQHPDVISAGGTYMHEDESLEASSYSSGFNSSIYSGRLVPDVCGLVGMLPKAMYIMLPVEPKDNIDTRNAGGSHPTGDETQNNDGWAAFSGTSAAAPQLAGVAALLKQACPQLKPKDIRDIMKKTARDVSKGRCSPSTGSSPGLGNRAKAGVDDATGHGLVDAHKATLLAKIRCIGPAPALIPPTPPSAPPVPQPTRAGMLSTPSPVSSVPTISSGLTQPVLQSQQLASQSDSRRLTMEDIQALEDMIIHGDFDVDG